jgi:hypothetical protein
LGDLRLCPHRINGDQGALQFQSPEQKGDGDDLVRLFRHRLLAQHELLPGGPGRHSVQGAAALGARMAAPRGLAVDGDRLRPGNTQSLDPVGKAGLEQGRVDGCDHLAKRVVARDAVCKRQEAAQERQVLAAPQRQLDEVV